MKNIFRYTGNIVNDDSYGSQFRERMKRVMEKPPEFKPLNRIDQKPPKWRREILDYLVFLIAISAFIFWLHLLTR